VFNKQEGCYDLCAVPLPDLVAAWNRRNVWHVVLLGPPASWARLHMGGGVRLNGSVDVFVALLAGIFGAEVASRNEQKHLILLQHRGDSYNVTVQTNKGSIC
jgi:hypothetical protein